MDELSYLVFFHICFFAFVFLIDAFSFLICYNILEFVIDNGDDKVQKIISNIWG